MEIQRSQKPMTYQVIGVIIGTIILLIFTTTIFKAIDNIMPWDWSGLTRFARLIVVGAGIIGILLTWLNAKKESYVLTNDAIVIRRGGISGKKEDIYSLKNVTSISVRQSFFGNRNNYGNIFVKMDKLEKNTQVNLSNVVTPRETAERINTAKSAL